MYVFVRIYFEKKYNAKSVQVITKTLTNVNQTRYIRLYVYYESYASFSTIHNVIALRHFDVFSHLWV